MPRYRSRQRQRHYKQSELEQQALERALENRSEANYPAIMAGFQARGIPAAEIKPRENVFTYNAWLRQGRQVMKGEHGVKIHTVIEVDKTIDPDTKQKVPVLKQRSATVFHVTQTKPVGQPDPEPSSPAPASPPPKRGGGSTDTAERLRHYADRLDDKIEHASRPMTQNHTAKRYSQFMSRMHEAECLKLSQEACRRLADLHERGDCPAELLHINKGHLVGSLVRPRCKSVPNGYHPYVVTDHGNYIDESPAARIMHACSPARRRWTSSGKRSSGWRTSSAAKRYQASFRRHTSWLNCLSARRASKAAWKSSNRQPASARSPKRL